MKEEIRHIRRVFTKTNGYPPNLVNSLIKKASESFKANSSNEENPESTEDDPKTNTLVMKVPYAGKTGDNLGKRFSKHTQDEYPT